MAKKKEKKKYFQFEPLQSVDEEIIPSSSTLWITPSEGVFISGSSTSTSSSFSTSSLSPQFIDESFLPAEFVTDADSLLKSGTIWRRYLEEEPVIQETEISLEAPTIRDLKETEINIIKAVKKEHIETKLHYEKQLKLAMQELATKNDIIKILDEKIGIVFSFKQLAIPLLYFFVATIAVSISATFLTFAFIEKNMFTGRSSILSLIFSSILLYTAFCHIKDIVNRTK